MPHTQTGEKKIPFKDAIAQTVEYRVWISAVVTQEESWRNSAAYSGVGTAQQRQSGLQAELATLFMNHHAHLVEELIKPLTATIERLSKNYPQKFHSYKVQNE